MYFIPSVIEQAPIPEKPLEKVEVLPEDFEDEVISVVTEPSPKIIPFVTAPPQEILTAFVFSEPDLAPIIEDLPEPPKFLSQEIEQSNSKEVVSLIPTIEVSDQTKPITGKISLVSYPYELDEVTLVWI